MPRPKGRAFKAIRMGRELVRIEFRYEGEYVRRTCRMDALRAFLLGGEPEESNLAYRAEPITFREYAEKKYLPFAARPRLKNPKSYLCEVNILKALSKRLGDRYLHEIQTKDAEALKEFWLKQPRVNSTIKKRLNGLRRVLDYAESAGLIKKNPIKPVKGLPVGDRSHIWLRLPEIDRLLEKCDPTIKPLVEYMVLTGARIGEALDFRKGDVRNGKLYVPTEKQGRSAREQMREFDIASLGPRFTALLARLTPHPETGFYFYALGHAGTGGALSYNYFQTLFSRARKAAGLAGDGSTERLHPHDLRGTFAMHRAMVINSFRQLQAELGHGNPRSMQAYLDRARQFDPKESIFYVEPTPPPKS